MNLHQITQQFQLEMASNGITPPQHIIANGKLHRFYVKGDARGTKNGWYVLYIDDIPCGVFGSWKEGESHKWCSIKRKKMSSVEYYLFIKQIEEAKGQRDAMRAMEQNEAAKQAESIYYSCSNADPHHLYLVRKRIKPFYAHQKGSYLVLPVIDFEGHIKSIQNIAPKKIDGRDKFFLPNGAIKGHFIPIQHQPAEDIKILICEGFATGATLAEAYPDSCVIAACYADNLKPVAIDIRKHLPKSEIVICADIDKIGLLKAYEASHAVKASIKKPRFPETVSSKLTDFNDLYCWHVSGGESNGHC